MDHLDAGLKQWLITGVSFAVSLIPLVGPLISCVIDGTFVDMWNAIKSGDWGALALCAMAFVPGMKQAKIGLKLASHADDVGKASKNLRKNLIKATGKDPGRAFEAHHNLPKKFEDFFKGASKSKIDINNPKYGAWVEKGSHRSDAYAFNKEWESAIASGRVHDKDSIEAFGRELAGGYGYDVRF